MRCACVPGVRRCQIADTLWEAANRVYRTQGYMAWLKALEPYNEHMEEVMNREVDGDDGAAGR